MWLIDYRNGFDILRPKDLFDLPSNLGIFGNDMRKEIIVSHDILRREGTRRIKTVVENKSNIAVLIKFQILESI